MRKKVPKVGEDNAKYGYVYHVSTHTMKLVGQGH